jgi:phosphohistidine phosphatase
MKILYLVRHAAAGGAKDGIDLHRPLSPDGRKQARRLAIRLVNRRVRPDLVLTSPADRAMETARCIAKAIGMDESGLLTDDRIYDASDTDGLLAVVRERCDSEGTVFLVGHQPVIGELTLVLVPTFCAPFPKAGTACIALDVLRWKDAGYGKGELVWFEAP